MTTEITEHYEATIGQSGAKQRHKTIEATIDTDASGDGSITVPFGEGGDNFEDDLTRHDFDAAPWVVLDDAVADDAASVADVTGDSLDVVLSGSATTEGTVTVRLQARGEA